MQQSSGILKCWDYNIAMHPDVNVKVVLYNAMQQYSGLLKDVGGNDKVHRTHPTLSLRSKSHLNLVRFPNPLAFAGGFGE